MQRAIVFLMRLPCAIILQESFFRGSIMINKIRDYIYTEFFFSSRRRHTRYWRDWSSDMCSSDLQIVALDGVPTGSQDGKRQGTIITRKEVFLSPAGRVEFIVQPPDSSVKKAEVITNYIDSGPQGDFLPARRLAVVQTATAIRKLP